MILPIQKLELGMRLARDVINLNGEVLLIKGTELTTYHLSALNRCGLNAVHIVNEASDPSGQGLQFSPEILKAAEEQVRFRFKHLPETTPGLATIREVAAKRIAMRLAHLQASPSPA